MGEKTVEEKEANAVVGERYAFFYIEHFGIFSMFYHCFGKMALLRLIRICGKGCIRKTHTLITTKEIPHWIFE